MTGKKKKLLAGGCSYTKRIHWSSNDVIFWPEFVAEDLNLECINKGRSGAGNDFIFNSMVRGIAENDDIELVVVLWTQIFRLNCWNFVKDTINIGDMFVNGDSMQAMVDPRCGSGENVPSTISVWHQQSYQKWVYDVSKIFLEKMKSSDDSSNASVEYDDHYYWLDQFIRNYFSDRL